MPTTTTSVRTFKTPPTTRPPQKPKRQLKLPAVPRIKLPTRLRVSRARAPWLVAAGFAIFSLFMVQQYNSAQSKLQPAKAQQAQVSTLIGKVGKLIILPKDETPSIATVAHADQLRGQQFFANAKDGDKVLVFSKTKQAILYRPSTNQLVNVAPVTGN